MNHFFPVLRLCAIFAATGFISISAIAPVEAQQTTAELKGVVFTVDGSAKAGASIEILHVNSGARWTTTTNEEGAYRVGGLRPGGPYTVTLTGTDVREQDVYLNISTPSYVYLAEGPGALEEITVTGTRTQAGLRMGSSTMIDNQQLNEAASISRDFKNILRVDPRVALDAANQNAISIGGVNNRYNSLTVDGVRQNDEFGLNQSGFPTQRTPVSMEAIEQISIETAPFGVEFGGFQGGTINIVTKSGDNDFHGSAFWNGTDDSYIGDKSEDRDINLGEFKEKFYGGTLSGPIIKDRLWFFVSYEKFEGSDPDATLFCPEGGGCANPIPGVTQADADLIRSIAMDVYGYDPLPLFTSATALEDKKWLAKIDWQISDNHNASFTYQFVEGNDLIDQGNSTFSQRLRLPSNFYNRGEKMKAFSAQLFSRWTDALSTEIKVASKDIDNLQAPLGGMDFAQMEVSIGDGAEIRFGPDFFRHANFLVTENFQLKAKADYAWRDHLFTFGYERDTVDTFNIFAPGSLGDYRFSSIEDFENQRASSLFVANISATGDVSDLAGIFKTSISSYYLQDRWDARDNLVVQAGIRIDDYTNGEAPFLNTNFLARNGFDNTSTLDNRTVVLPRFGFNWQPRERTTIRGGVGLFSGGVPTGFLSNAFSNVGLLNQSGFFAALTLKTLQSMASISIRRFLHSFNRVMAMSPPLILISIYHQYGKLI